MQNSIHYASLFSHDSSLEFNSLNQCHPVGNKTYFQFLNNIV